MKQLTSMTGFASVSDAAEGLGWAWELRSVNGRGLDLKFRLPQGLEGLEATLRAAAGRFLARGTVTANLRLQAPDSGGLVIDRALLLRLADEADAVARLRISAKADGGANADGANAHGGVTPVRIELLMGLPGVVRRDSADGPAALAEPAMRAVQAGFAVALEQMVAARRAEGARLQAVLESALDRLAGLHAEAAPAAAAQAEQQKARLGETVGALLGEWPALPAERLAQELAVLVSRSDVTEEIDRLASHLDAARALLRDGGTVGRQLDFLVQEFMREANTLCSKSASIELTGLGLQMKGVIEQIREQVQNIE